MTSRLARTDDFQAGSMVSAKAPAPASINGSRAADFDVDLAGAADLRAAWPPILPATLRFFPDFALPDFCLPARAMTPQIFSILCSSLSCASQDLRTSAQ